MFIIASVLPLFLLSVVFTGISRFLVQKNTLRNCRETMKIEKAIMENEAQKAKSFSQSIASRNDVIEWCSTPSRQNSDSIAISDLFQFIAKKAGSDDFQVTVISLVKNDAVSRFEVCDEYKSAVYRDWGILHKARFSDETVFFARANKTSVFSACTKVGEYGFVIVDVLKKGLSQKIAEAKSINMFSDFFVVDESRCIALSAYSPDKEGCFLEHAEKNKRVFSEKCEDTPFWIAAVFSENSDKRYTKDLRLMALLTSVIASILASLLSAFISHSVSEPVQNLCEAMKKAEKGDLSARCEESHSKKADRDMIALVRRFNKMAVSIEQLTEERVKSERLLRIAEVKNLQAQISPHFLYNTLNSIKSMAKFAGASNISKMVTSLAKLLRSSFASEDTFCTIEQSLELVRNYFCIETLRYDNKFSFIENIDNAVLSCTIPRLVLQPVVENAIVHGLEEKSGSGTLFINGYISDNDDIVLEVKDDGDGMNEEQLSKLQESLAKGKKVDDKKDENLGSNGIALLNTNARLRLLYGKDYSLKIESEKGKGTCVTIKIPKGRQNDKSAGC